MRFKGHLEAKPRDLVIAGFLAALEMTAILGCQSPTYQRASAEFYVMRAEKAMKKAREPEKFPRETGFEDPNWIACDYYAQAYYRNFRTLNLDNIENAIDACMSANSYERAKSFMGLRDRYAETHREEAKENKVPEWIEKSDPMRQFKKKLVKPSTVSPHAPPSSFLKAIRWPRRVPVSGTKPGITRIVSEPEPRTLEPERALWA